MKIVTVIGARPQFIKAAAVSREFSSDPSIEEIIVHTGQHFDANMSEIFFQELDIPAPHYNLSINGGSHGAMTGKMLEQIEEVVIKEKPDFLLVFGDTNSTLAGALAAKKLHCKVVHVEAGLRSYNIKMPEEVNRIVTDRISDILFCPTEQAVKNLQEEGFGAFPARIVACGDVMCDAALYYAQKSDECSQIIHQLELKEFILCTLHRAENTDSPERLQEIISALNEIHGTVPIVVPLHPRTRKVTESLGIEIKFRIIEPVGYLDMIQLIKSSVLVMTDSGGLQKEAFFFGKHCVTLRDETEWVELVNNGFNLLAGAKQERIVGAVKQMLNKESDFEMNLYGAGRASKIIRDSIKEYFLNN
jgi:UDP-GlcNAc3NAcA epimerase